MTLFQLVLLRLSSKTQYHDIARICLIVAVLWGLKMVESLHVPERIYHVRFASMTDTKTRLGVSAGKNAITSKYNDSVSSKECTGGLKSSPLEHCHEKMEDPASFKAGAKFTQDDPKGLAAVFDDGRIDKFDEYRRPFVTRKKEPRIPVATKNRKQQLHHKMVGNNKFQATSNTNLPEKLSSVLSYCRISNPETCAALVEMGSVKVNGKIITSPSFKVNIVEDEILVRGEVATLPPVIDNGESIVDRKITTKWHGLYGRRFRNNETAPCPPLRHKARTRYSWRIDGGIIQAAKANRLKSNKDATSHRWRRLHNDLLLG